MIQNKLILYCSRLEQAILWEACKRRRCATSNCQFQKIAKHYGENLWSPKPMRISTITDAKDQLECLTMPVPLIRTPVLNTDIEARAVIAPIYETEPELRKELQKELRPKLDIDSESTPSPARPKEKPGPSYLLPSDMIRASIIEQVKASK